MILFFSTCNWTALLTYTRNGNIGGVFPSFKSDFVLLGFDARNMTLGDDFPKKEFYFGHFGGGGLCPNCLALNVFLVYFFTKVVQNARIGGEFGKETFA